MEPGTTPAVYAVVLAAGLGSRLGSGKLLLDLRGRPMVMHAVLAALGSEASHTIVVLGHDARKVESSIRGHLCCGEDFVIVHNPAYATGQSSSLRAGLLACRGQADAALLCLADQPLVTSDIMNLIIRAYLSASPRPLVVAPIHGGTRGNPVLVDHRLFDEIIDTVTGDTGARGVLRRHTHHTRLIATGPEVLLDIDTESDLASVRNTLRECDRLSRTGGP